MSDSLISLTQLLAGMPTGWSTSRVAPHRLATRYAGGQPGLVLLYWHSGREILARQAEQGWGAQVIKLLAQDLRNAS